MVQLNMPLTKEQLDFVFGKDSSGSTPEERARTSKIKFVRSQVQIAPVSKEATGRIFSAHEIYSTFGWEPMYTCALEGSARIISSHSEPAASLKKGREELGLTAKDLAQRIGCTVEEIEDMETEGVRNPYKLIERFGSAIALNEKLLGAQSNPGRDTALGVRLRELSTGGDMSSFGPSTVMSLAEAAWIISNQKNLESNFHFEEFAFPKHNPNFSYPSYETGYVLAEKTRALLSLRHDEPIKSVRELIEYKLNIPLIQDKLNQRFAGATISNGNNRGIVINEVGLNKNVWVRRMTLCHELGHLLWDPEEKLEKVKVDDYGDLEEDIRSSKRDPAEIRANAFAISFLAPRSAVLEIHDSCSDPKEALCRLMVTFGISGTAAKHHYANITGDKSVLRVSPYELPEPDGGWYGAENLAVDYFPIKSTPINRRGRFSWLVAKAATENLLSIDTAAFYLKCTPSDAESSFQKILQLYN